MQADEQTAARAAHASRPNRWRTAFLVLLAAAVGVAGFLVYGIVDQGVTLTYQADEHQRVREDLAVALRALPALAPAADRSTVLATLRRQHLGALITATDSTVGIGQLTFRFGRDGRIREVVRE